MKFRLSRGLVLLTCVALAPAGLTTHVPGRAPPGADVVVLLHGLARSADSMLELQEAMLAAGYAVCNIDYPSRDHSLETLASQHVLPAIQRCVGKTDRPVHFVTHSMGGILVRKIESLPREFQIGRVVMLGPPNGGSEVVDKLSGFKLFKTINGPAGMQLGTQNESPPHALGDTHVEVGVIAGNRTINPVLSLMIPGDDDGKVSLESAKLQGMSDYIIVAASHPFLMKDADAIAQTKHFLKNGCFSHLP